VEAAGAEVPPLSDEVAAKLAELGIDFERSGLKYLPNEARVGADDARFGPPAGCLISPPARPGNRACLAALWVPALTRSACRTVGRLPSLSLGFLPLQMRALDRKSAKFEKTKNEKCGSHMWEDVTQLAQLIREGKTSWQDLDLDDVDVRLKWAGLFHRRKRTPGRFMMRLKV
jgi:hypothetical protein